MSDEESTINENTVIPITKRSRPIPKNKTGLLSTHKSILDADLDKNCLYDFSDTLVRIEYPGRILDVTKAIETLGGINEIQKSVEGKNKMELKFHPSNQFNGGCIADKDTNVAILLKVKQDRATENIAYEVIGPTAVNYKFNRMCDFQYLPLVAKDKPEHEESEVDYLYDKIILDKIPTLEWFTNPKTVSQPPFLTSSCYARFDLPQNKFHISSSETFVSLVRPDFPKADYSYRNKRAERQKTIFSIQISFTKKNLRIPDQPLTAAMEVLREKCLQPHYSLVHALFSERPVWKKAAIMYKTKLNDDQSKYVLPTVAYYCLTGPWRTCWIRFGYDPTKDYNSRIYQTLDYRIRTTEGMKFKVKSRRGTNFFEGNEGASLLKDQHVEERDYILRSNYLPPARQMFYQYCDILIPEIQEMLAKLPKLPPTAKYDFKNGWLPLSFTEHCRETVNKYVMERVQKELLKERKMQEAEISECTAERRTEKASTYCSKMLSNIKKGIYRSINFQEIGESSTKDNREHGPQEDIEEIDLSDDCVDLEQIDADEVVNSLPERILENSDDDSDLDIDMEAVEEVNEMVSAMRQNENIDDYSFILK